MCGAYVDDLCAGQDLETDDNTRYGSSLDAFE